MVRSKQKGPFTSTDGKYRKFTDDAEVDLQFLVEKHKEDIAKGRTFVDSCDGGVVLACVFYRQLADQSAIRRLCWRKSV